MCPHENCICAVVKYYGKTVFSISYLKASLFVLDNREEEEQQQLLVTQHARVLARGHDGQEAQEGGVLSPLQDELDERLKGANIHAHTRVLRSAAQSARVQPARAYRVASYVRPGCNQRMAAKLDFSLDLTHQLLSRLIGICHKQYKAIYEVMTDEAFRKSRMLWRACAIIAMYQQSFIPMYQMDLQVELQAVFVLAASICIKDEGKPTVQILTSDIDRLKMEFDGNGMHFGMDCKSLIVRAKVFPGCLSISVFGSVLFTCVCLHWVCPTSCLN